MDERGAGGSGACDVTFQSDLDQFLAADGQDVILRRLTGTTNQVAVDCPCRAFVRGYQPKELAGGIIQGDTHVILSATDIIRAQWPGGEAVTNPPAATDPRVPRKGDRVIIEGKARTVEYASPTSVNGILHRIDLTVRG